MKKKGIAFIMLFVFILSKSSIASAAIPDNINAFAQSEGLKSFKATVAEDPAGYGYKDAEEVNNVQLGDGFQVNYIDPNKLKSANSNASISSIIKPVEQWDFIILSNGKPKSFLTIGKENNEIKVISGGDSSVDFGAAYDKLLASNVDKNTLTLVFDKGVRIFVANKDKTEVAVPGLSSKTAKYLNGLDNTKLSSSAQLLSQLKAAQQSPDQDKDSGGLVNDSPESGKTTIPWVAICTSLGIALLVVLMFSSRMRRSSEK